MWFFVFWVPKLSLTPIKIRIFGPKTAKFGPKYAFLVIFGQILAFFALFSILDQKNNANKVPGWFFIMWVTKHLISPGKIRIFCPKTIKIGTKLAFLFILGQALPAHLVPCWWVGWLLWRAGCISQDTYLLYISR